MKMPFNETPRMAPSQIRPSGCSLGKKIACGAGGLAAATVACGGGAFLATPPCILAIDQLAGLGCCDCLPKGKVRDFCREL